MAANRDNSIELALIMAAEAHFGQVDKLGQPYILHVIAVVNSCETLPQKIVAALHDIVEDTSVTLGDLEKHFPAEVVAAVDAITHREDEPREVYLQRVKANPLALAVKKADVAHNMSRLAALEGTEHRSRLAAKYEETTRILYS